MSRIDQIFTKIVTNTKIANAYLLGGASVSTMADSALSFVQKLNCSEARKNDCNCENCKKLRNQTHPDYIVLNSENTSIKINQIREIKDVIQYGPSFAMYKVIVVHYATKLTVEAANSFLKILEEQPEGVVFILLATNYQSLPITIRSRCQLFLFPQESRLDFYRDFTSEFLDVFTFLEKVMHAEFSVYEILQFIERELIPYKERISDIMEMIIFFLIEKIKHNQLSSEMGSRLRAVIEESLIKTKYFSKNTLNIRLQLEALFLNLYAVVK